LQIDIRLRRGMDFSVRNFIVSSVPSDLFAQFETLIA
jgi:hypothetical protein